MKALVFALAAAPLLLLASIGDARAGIIFDLEDPDAFPYTEHTIPVVATGATTTLTFAGYQLPSWFSLDDVSFGLSGGPNLIVNGGFETGDTTGWTETMAPPDSTDFFVGGNFGTHSGSFAANFGAVREDEPDSLSQTVATVPGETYIVDFWLQNLGGTPSGFTVSTDAGPSAVPEPGTLTLLGIGFVGLAAVKLRRRR